MQAEDDERATATLSPKMLDGLGQAFGHRSVTFGGERNQRGMAEVGKPDYGTQGY